MKIQRNDLLGSYQLFSSQRGITTFVVLAFVVMMTLITMAITTMTNSHEKVTRNFRDYNIAFQAAEAALRDAEIRLQGEWVFFDTATYGTSMKPLESSAFNTQCNYGLCLLRSHSRMDIGLSQLEDPSKSIEVGAPCPNGCDGKGGRNEMTGSPQFQTGMVSDQPRYLIQMRQFLSQGGARSGLTNQGLTQEFTVTAVGYGQKSIVILETVYIR